MSGLKFSGTIQYTLCTEMFHGKYVQYLEFFSDRFVSNINVPFLVLQAKDDPICTLDNMPMNDLLKNPFCFIIKLKHGGHCDFFTKVPGQKKYKRVSSFLF